MLAQLYDSGRTTERHAIDADATLRSQDQVPVDVLVADLSATGCLFVCAEPLDLDAEITIGIAGIGRRPARIVRATDQRYGCAFLAPLSDADVAAIRAEPGGTIVSFPTWLPGTASDEDLPPADKLPGSVRLAIVIGATVSTWSAIVALVHHLR